MRAPGKGESWDQAQIVGAFQRFRDYYGRPPTATECKAVHGQEPFHHPATLPQLRRGRSRSGHGPRNARSAAQAMEAYRGRRGLRIVSPPQRLLAKLGRRQAQPGRPTGHGRDGEILCGTRSADVQTGAEALLFGFESRVA